jgi:cell division protein FtsL
MSISSPPGSEERRTAPPPRVRRYGKPAPEQPRGRVSSAIIYIIVAVLVGAVGLLYLVQTNHVAGLGYEMSRLQAERTDLANRNEALNYQLAEYEALNRIEEIAVGQLGMQEATEYIFLTVPRPENDRLPLIEPVQVEEPGLLERIWRGMTGSSVAVAPSTGQAGE